MTVHQYYIPLDAPAEWRQALAGIKHSFGHTWGNCYAMHLSTGLPTYLYCYESDDVRIVCPVAEREYGGFIDIVKPFGFSGFVGTGDDPGFYIQWKKFARQHGYVCGFLGLNPVFNYSGTFPREEIFQYDSVYVLNLTLSMDQLFANLHRARQRELKKRDGTNPDLVFNKPALAAFFTENYTDFIRSKHADSFYYFSPECLSFLMGLDSIMLVGAQISGKIVAVTVFAFTPYAADALFNISFPEGRQYTGAINWYGVNYFKSCGIPSLNLGGGGGGVGESKRRYGCAEYPLQCVKQIYDPDGYRTLCHRNGADPDNTSGYFPAYRKPA